MLIQVLASPQAHHQKLHQRALIEGLSVHGIEAKPIYSGRHATADIVACWGWKHGKYLRDEGREVLVMERGYIGDRFSYTSLSWNGLNGHAQWPELPYDGGERFRRLGCQIGPWRSGGDYALILGQVPRDASLQGLDMVPWYVEKAEEISRAYGLPVHFRQHPDLTKMRISQSVPGTIKSTGNLSDALAGAAFTVCYNSNSSVDSVMAGIPCVVGDRGSMAYDLCSKDINNLIRPDRTEWAHRLAQKQWLLTEISNGCALEGVLCKLGV